MMMDRTVFNIDKFEERLERSFSLFMRKYHFQSSSSRELIEVLQKLKSKVNQVRGQGNMEPDRLELYEGYLFRCIDYASTHLENYGVKMPRDKEAWVSRVELPWDYESRYERFVDTFTFPRADFLSMQSVSSVLNTEIRVIGEELREMGENHYAYEGRKGYFQFKQRCFAHLHFEQLKYYTVLPENYLTSLLEQKQAERVGQSEFTFNLEAVA